MAFLKRNFLSNTIKSGCEKGVDNLFKKWIKQVEVFVDSRWIQRNTNTVDKIVDNSG
jgi:hypothetical protein